MTNIITIDELKNSVLNANIDDEYIQPAIDEAQSIYLREILGDALLNAIINKINGNSLTGKYLTLVNDYVKPYLSYMIQSIIVVPITYKIRNAGVIQQYDNGFTTTQMKDTQYLKDYYDGKAEFYGNRLTEWLRKNANDIVEYRLSASNVTNPTTSQNVTNIFLGGTKRGKCGYVSTSGGGGTHDTVDWDDITNRPDFATVATSGSYNDLSNKPEIPSLDGYATEQWVENQGYSTFSGDYNDLENKPEIPTVNNATLTIAQGGVTKGTFTANAGTDVTINLDGGGSGSTDWNDIENKPDFATVATSGSYNDLNDIPSYFSYIHENGSQNGVMLDGETQFGEITADIAGGIQCNFKVDLAQVTKLYSDYIITGENTNGRTELVISGDDGNNVYGKIAKDGIYEGNTKLEAKYLQINDLPANVSAFNNDAGYTTFDGDYNSLTNKPTIPAAPVQSDWNENDNTSLAYIQNKPTIPAPQVQADWQQNDSTQPDYIKNRPSMPSAQIQSDWNQTNTSEVDYIKNKPTIPTVPTNVSAFTNDAGYLTQHQSLAGYATEQWVENQGYSTFSGDYNDLENKPEIPTVNNATLTIAQGGVTKGTFTANAGTDVTINLDGGGSGSTDWNDIENKPDFATVATSGSYNDLNDIPSYFSYIHENGSQNGVMLDGETQFGEITADIAGGIQCNFKVDLAQVTKLYSDYIITGENTNGRTELVISGDDGNNVYGKIAKDGIYEGNTKLEAKYLQINDLPANVSAFNNDAGYTTFDGDYNSLTNKPTIPAAPVQSDWNENDNTSLAYIQNKPTIPAPQVQADWQQNDSTQPDYIKNRPSMPSAQIQSDWNQTNTSEVDYIKNKPTIPTVPTNVSAFTNDAGYLTQHQSLAGYATETWVQQQGYSTFDGDYNSLANKPTIPAAQVQSDWNANSGMGEILNKPSMTAETWTFTLSDNTTVTKTVWLQ